jgi:hypothetical protein
MEIHQQLLGSLSVEAPDDELFLSYVSRHTSRKEAFDLAEFLDTLPLKDHEKLCSQTIIGGRPCTLN